MKQNNNITSIDLKNQFAEFVKHVNKLVEESIILHNNTVLIDKRDDLTEMLKAEHLEELWNALCNIDI